MRLTLAHRTVLQTTPGGVDRPGENGAASLRVGQVTQATGGSADPGTVDELLCERIDR